MSETTDPTADTDPTDTADDLEVGTDRDPDSSIDPTDIPPELETEAAEAEEEVDLTAADIFPCEEDEDEDDICTEPLCPECVPDPDYPESQIPDWKNRVRPFLNKKTCDYCVTVWTDYTLEDWTDMSGIEMSTDSDALFDDWIKNTVMESAKVTGLAKLIRFYAKDLNWVGPLDLCRPDGSIPAPGSLESPIESGCARLGGGATRSADAEDTSDYETIDPASKERVYFDIEGNMTENNEPIEHGTVSRSPSSGKDWYYDADNEDGSNSPYGWNSETSFFKVSSDPEDEDAPSAWRTYRDYVEAEGIAFDETSLTKADALTEYIPTSKSTTGLRIDLAGNLWVWDADNESYHKATSSQSTVLYQIESMYLVTGNRTHNEEYLSDDDPKTFEDWATMVIEYEEEVTEETAIEEEEEEAADIEFISHEQEEQQVSSGPSADVGIATPSKAWQYDVEQSPAGQYLLTYDQVMATDWYVSNTAGSRIKVLICIPSLIFSQIPEAAPGEDQPYSVTSEEGVDVSLPYEVEFTTEDVADGMFTRVRWLINHYGKKRVPMAYEDNRMCVIETLEDTGVPEVDEVVDDDEYSDAESVNLEDNIDSYEPAVSTKRLNAWNTWLNTKYGEEQPPNYKKILASSDLVQQATNLRDFKNNLLDFLNENTDGWQFTYLGEHNKKNGIENIKIEFSPTYSIQSVTYNLRGCPPITLTGQDYYKTLLQEKYDDEEYLMNPFVNPEFKIAKGWDDFANTYPQTDPRTMAYVASITYMDDVAKATTPMEWQDFITLWTYPKVRIANFNELADNDPACNSTSSALEGILQSGVNVFIETLTSKFDQQLCQTIEEGSEAWADYWTKYHTPDDPENTGTRLRDPRGDPEGKLVKSPFGQDLEEATKAAVNQVLTNDPFMSQMIDSLDYIRSADDLWRKILGQLGVCGLLDFLETLFQCLFNGVDFGDILEKALISALQNMDMNLFKRLLVGLPPHVQNEIAANATAGLSENLQDWRPWDKEPSLERQQRTAQVLQDAAIQKHYEAAQEQLNENPTTMNREQEVTLTTTEQTGLGPDDYTTTTQTETLRWTTSHSSIDDPVNSAAKQEAYEEGLADAATITPSYQGTDDASKTKTLGSVLVDSGAVKDIKDAYIKALMDLLQPDEILDLLENIPGFTFLRNLIDLTKCPGVAIFHPPIKGWYNDLTRAISQWDFGFCRSGKPLIIPRIVFNRPYRFWDAMKAIGNLILAALEAAIVQALMTMLKKILEWIFGVLCSLMNVLGSAALTATGLMSAGEFSNLLKDTMCGTNATDNEIATAMATILSALGATGAQTEEELLAIGEIALTSMGSYMEVASVRDSLELLGGSPSTRALRDAADFYRYSETPLAGTLGNANNLRALYKTIGQTFIGTKTIDALRDSYLESKSCVDEDGCGPVIPFCGVREPIKDAFCNLGIPEEACEHLTDSTLADLDSTLDEALKLAQSGGDISNLLPTGSLIPCENMDDGSFLPRDTAFDRSMFANDVGDDIQFLQITYERELIGPGGLMDRIQSDMDGRGKQEHDRRLVDLLEKAIAGNPETVGKYLRDIMRSGATEEGATIRVHREIASSTVIDNYGRNFTFLNFDPVEGVGYGALDGGFSKSWDNSLGTYQGKNVYVSSYGRVWEDTKKYYHELDSNDRKLDKDESTAYDVWEVNEAYKRIATDWGVEYEYDPRYVIYRKYKIGKEKFHYYPEPHARMQFMGTDPSMGANSHKEAGQPAYHFHFWNEERNELDFIPEGYTDTALYDEEELTKDVGKLHIFRLVPNAIGVSRSSQAASSVGEYTMQFDKDRRGNFDSFFKGFGPLSNGAPNSSRSKSALDPIIRVVRALDSDILDHISSMELDVANRQQKPTIWATHITNVIESAIVESGEEAEQSNLESVWQKLYGQDYSGLCESFVEEYAAQISDDDDAWDSGLLNFYLKELSEEECLDAGISKFKGDDEDKKEIPLPRSTRKKNRKEFPYHPNNNEDTGWYRPVPVPGSEGLSEIVDLPEEEYGVGAYYVHQQYQKGWARIADEYLPGPANPCEEQVSADIFNWSGVAEHISKAMDNIDSDDRVSSDPSCVWDPPFDRVNDRESKAKIEGYIKATMRTTIFEKMICAVPAFMKFNPSTGCFGDLLAAYIFANLRESLFQYSRRSKIFGSLGRISKGHNRYDYKFLEQCCAMYARQVSAGNMSGSAEALMAVEKIDEINTKLYNQPQADWFHRKRKARRRKVWENSEPYMTTVAKELFRHEFEEGSGKFANWACSEIDNLQLHFLQGGLNLSEGPIGAYVTDVAVDLQEDRFGGEGYYSGNFAYLQNGGFVVEKYIKIEDYEDSSEAAIDLDTGSRSEHLFKIVNMEEWKTYLSENNNFTYTSTTEEGDEEDSYKISDLFEKWSYGLRLSYVPSFHGTSDIQQLCGQVSSDISLKNKAFNIEYLGGDPVNLIPIASTEIEIPGDLKINNFDIVEDYDFECMLDQFISDTEFRTLFEYVFALDRFLSLPTIYMMHCFLDSIGMDDGWYQEVSPENAPGDGPGDPYDGSRIGQFMRNIQHSAGPGLETGDWLLWFKGQQKKKSYRNWDKYGKAPPFGETKELLRDFFMHAYDWDNKVNGKFSLPKFKFKVNLPPFFDWNPKFFVNRQLEGPECDDDMGADAEKAAYNSG